MPGMTYMARMFGMQDAPATAGGRPIIEDELWQLDLDYPSGETPVALCRVGPIFVEPVDDNVPTEPDEEVEYFTDQGSFTTHFCVLDGMNTGQDPVLLCMFALQLSC
ncbi:hypothetical protein HAX54_042766 [Datura stramonium]|uniref:Uncharacterized protein n=1 Tax=Datura stramonium TaxID=4076 RepID=A0ABS8W0B3_DATST|nr:hypothetical protein [Datura stramonium]